MAKLTTTTYAILGLLQRRPWSAYELTKYMQRSGVRAVWPRTESRIYLEFKNLIALNLAVSEDGIKRGRKRKVYSITIEGKQKLNAWLHKPEGGLRLESEPLLKFLYADLDQSSLNVQLPHMRDQLLFEIKLMQQAIASALKEGFFFEDNAVHNAHLISLLTGMLEARTTWLLETTQALPQLKDQTNRVGKATKRYRKLDKKLEELVGKLEE